MLEAALLLAALASEAQLPAAEALELRFAPAGIPLCKPRINGREVGWFVFDTGASEHVIDEAVSAELGLEYAASSPVITEEGRRELRLVWASSLELGSKRWPRSRFVELDLSPLEEHLGSEVVGVLGYEAFSSSVLEFDYRGGTIKLHDPASFAGDGLDWMPLKLVSQELCVEAHIEGSPALVQVDTGSNGGITIHEHAARRLRLLEGRETRPSMGIGVFGSRARRTGLLESFQVAGRTWKDTPAEFGSPASGSADGGPVAGLIGCGYLEAFTIYLDCSARRASFREHAPTEVSARLLAALPGIYTVESSSIEIRLRGDRLAVLASDGRWIPLTPGEQDLFHFEGQTRRLRARLEDGRVGAVDVVRPGSPEVRLERSAP